MNPNMSGHPSGPDTPVAHVFSPLDDASTCVCGQDRFTGVHVAIDGSREVRHYRSTRLSTVTPERVEWLWPGRIPLGKLTVLDGDPGVGKSTLATTFAAHVTTGTPWPDGTPCPRGGVVMLSGEDGVADTVLPRFIAAGIGDADRFDVLEAVSSIDRDGMPLERDPHLADTVEIQRNLLDMDARLLIVDVLMAFMPPGVDSHKDQDVRGILRRLKQTAEATGAAVLLLRHLNKATGGHALYRGGGSIGIVGAARSGLIAGKDPEDGSLMVLASTKSNLAKPPPSLSYRIADHDGTGRVEWAGQVDRTAGELLQDGDTDTEERDALAAFLIDYMTELGGQATAKDAAKAVADAFGQVPKATMKRARDRARIVTKKAGYKRGWVWELSEGSIEGSEGSSFQDRGTFGTFVEPSTDHVGTEGSD